MCRKRFSRSDNLTQHARTHARSSDSGAATFGQGMFGDEDADADADNEGLDHWDDDDSDFAAYVSIWLVEVEVQGELPEEGLPSATAGVHTSPQEL